MDFIQIVEMISEIGIMAVIAAVYILQTKKTQDNNERRTDELMKEQRELNRKAFEAVLDATSTTHILSQDEAKALMGKNRVIDEYLKRLIAETGATKALVVRYHNGGRDLTGNPFLKMSMTNEAVNIGYKPTIMDYQNQFQSMLSYIVDKIDASGECLIYDIESINDLDHGTYEFLKSFGIVAWFGKAIVNLDGQTVGFIAIHYNAQTIKSFEPTKVLPFLDKKASNIGALLTIEK